MRISRTCAALAALTIAGAACGDAPRDGEEPPAEIQEAALAGTLSPEVLRDLMEKYPRLRSDPRPEPQPSPGADPSRIPDRLEAALPDPVLQRVTGEATFYANRFEGRRTASGVPFRQNQLVAAHRSFPFGTLLRVTNTRNDRAVNVRVVDRGPFGSAAKQRRTIIDLSRRAAERLGFVDAGRAQVRVEVLEWGAGLPRSG
jgi:rare lipoprotein A